MSPTIALASAELRMLVRNRMAAITALLAPLAGGLWLVTDAPADSPIGSVSALAAVQLLGVLGMTVVTTATSTLVARRQQRVLERWRTSGVRTATILAGTLAPLVVLLAAQTGILFAATGTATGSAPDRPVVLALAVVLGGGLAGALAFVTAALTRTVEAVSLTVLPAVGALLGGGLWTTTASAGQITWAMRVTGGGAIVELTRLGWSGPTAGGGSGALLAAAGPPVAALAALIAAGLLAAAATFRWHARS